MFGFVRKELLQSAEAEISQLSRKLSELEGERKKLGELLKLAQNELTQIRESELYKSGVALEALRNEVATRTEQKVKIESEITEIKNKKLEIIECEVNKEKSCLRTNKEPILKLI